MKAARAIAVSAAMLMGAIAPAAFADGANDNPPPGYTAVDFRYYQSGFQCFFDVTYRQFFTGDTIVITSEAQCNTPSIPTGVR